MERQVGQMARLVDDLLDVTRITSNKLELRKERVELASVVRQAVEISRPLAERAGHELTVALPPEPVYLHADPVRLAQVFSNLLNNACKYTDRGRADYLVIAGRQGNEAVVKVADTGIGIPVEKLSSVFELFAQIQSATGRVARWAGDRAQRGEAARGNAGRFGPCRERRPRPRKRVHGAPARLCRVARTKTLAIDRRRR